MVEKVNVVRIDDIDQQTPATARRHFSIDGNHYQIDLNAENAARFDADVNAWVRHARTALPVRRKVSRKRPRKTQKPRENVRQWARENGWDIADSGRIPERIRTAYENRGQN